MIQAATLDSPNDIFSGGTVTVNDQLITIPRNTLFQFPATGMTWQEMFKLAPAPYGLNAAGGPQSGLALADNPPPFATYEVTVIGNRVIRSATDDKYVAALVFIAKEFLNAGQGFINAMDYTTGDMWIGSTLTARTGARLQINTPQRPLWQAAVTRRALHQRRGQPDNRGPHWLPDVLPAHGSSTGGRPALPATQPPDRPGHAHLPDRIHHAAAGASAIAERPG